MTADRPQLTILLPAFNEAENLAVVIDEIVESLDSEGLTHEIVVIDDGSTDNTPDVLVDVGSRHPQLRWARLRRNSGKSAALQVGLATARGELIGLMDADGQDHPAEIPRMIEALDGDLDLVTGRRSIRNDRFIKRNTSKVYNWATVRVTGVDGKDFNSGFKLMRAEVAASLDMYGELHRYIPVLASWAGFRVGEIEVEHRQRHAGTSKFGFSRFYRGLFDLITVKFITTYNARPFHLFGGLGLALMGVGALLLLWMSGVWLFTDDPIGSRPALLAGVSIFLIGLQLLSVGLLAELFVSRTSEGGPPPTSVRWDGAAQLDLDDEDGQDE